MSKKLIAKKGYTVEVTSWENDGDNYATKTESFKDKDKALAVLQLCKELFGQGDGGIGNYQGDTEERIIVYAKKHPKLMMLIFGKKLDLEDDDVIDSIRDTASELVGYSECCDASRVFESGSVFYAAENVYLEKISPKKIK